MMYNVNMENDNYVSLNAQDLAEVSPTASSDMQQAFIDTFRETQGANTAQLGEQAHALGSDLEAQYGGLHGPSEYIKSRYQTPQTESRVAALRTASQLSALNQLLQNEQANWKDQVTQKQREYNKAVLAANKRARDRAKAAAAAAQSPTTTGGNDYGGDTNIIRPVNRETHVSNAAHPGWNDTSYYDQDGHLHNIYTNGPYRVEYVDGNKTSDNTAEVDASVGGGGGGGGW